jgi:hypothetical protein
VPEPIDPQEDAFMEASAAMLGLTITAAHKPAIVENLRLIRGHLANVLSFEMPDREEPAPVYEP